MSSGAAPGTAAAGEKAARHIRPRTAAVGLALIVVLLVALRLPFLSQLLIDEEGAFAYLVMGERSVIAGVDTVLIGRVDGADRLSFPARHPVPYLLLDRIVRPLLGTASIEGMSIQAISRAARLPFLALWLVGFAAAALVAVRSLVTRDTTERGMILLVFAFAMSTPLLVGGSVQAQMDGSIGVMATGLAAMLLILSRRSSAAAAFACGALAGIVTAAFKNEWAGTLIAAAVVALVAKLARRRTGPGPDGADHDVAMLAGTVAGAATTIGVIFALYPAIFTATFDLALATTAAPTDFMFVFRRQIRFIYPLLLIGALAAWLVARRPGDTLDRRCGALVVALWGAFIAAGFVVARFLGDGFPRHFIPATLLLTIGTIGLSSGASLNVHLRRVVMAVAAIGIAVNLGSLARNHLAGRSITSFPGIDLAAVERRFADDARRAATEDAIFIEFTAVAIYHRQVQFAALSLGAEGALAWVRRWRPGFNGALVPPDR